MDGRKYSTATENVGPNKHKVKMLHRGQKVVGFYKAGTKKESPRQAVSKPVNLNEESAGESGMTQYHSGKA